VYKRQRSKLMWRRWRAITNSSWNEIINKQKERC